ncbi:MAG: hypothetical protein QXF92_01930, partial [Thermosphaera sp.]
MKAVSSLVATALLLALTIAGGIMLYNYVYSYLSGGARSGGVEIVYAALYDYGSTRELYAEVLNTGLKPVKIDRVVLVQNGSVIYSVQVDSAVIPPGGKTSIAVGNITLTSIDPAKPLYVRVYYDGEP